MIHRAFVYLYDFDVCDEEAYLLWRDDLNDTYPGKTTALFKVNKFLVWLQTPDSDSGEEEEEEDEK